MFSPLYTPIRAIQADTPASLLFSFQMRRMPSLLFGLLLSSQHSRAVSFHTVQPCCTSELIRRGRGNWTDSEFILQDSTSLEPSIPSPTLSVSQLSILTPFLTSRYITVSQSFAPLALRSSYLPPDSDSLPSPPPVPLSFSSPLARSWSTFGRLCSPCSSTRRRLCPRIRRTEFCWFVSPRLLSVRRVLISHLSFLFVSLLDYPHQEFKRDQARSVTPHIRAMSVAPAGPSFFPTAAGSSLFLPLPPFLCFVTRPDSFFYVYAQSLHRIRQTSTDLQRTSTSARNGRRRLSKSGSVSLWFPFLVVVPNADLLPLPRHR